MNLEILNNGYRFGTKILFAIIHMVSHHPVPDAAKLFFYRPEFYGSLMKKLTQEAMRGQSAWSVGDRELMAAYVSKMNDCPFCIKAHTATASMAYQDEEKVTAVLRDLESACIDEQLLMTLRMLGKLTREQRLQAKDMQEVLNAGVSRKQIEEALAVCFAFNVIDRLANSFDFEIMSPEGFAAGWVEVISFRSRTTRDLVLLVSGLIAKSGVSAAAYTSSKRCQKETC